MQIKRSQILGNSGITFEERRNQKPIFDTCALARRPKQCDLDIAIVCNPLKLPEEINSRLIHKLFELEYIYADLVYIQEEYPKFEIQAQIEVYPDFVAKIPVDTIINFTGLPMTAKIDFSLQNEMDTDDEISPSIGVAIRFSGIKQVSEEDPQVLQKMKGGNFYKTILTDGTTLEERTAEIKRKLINLWNTQIDRRMLKQGKVVTNS